MSHFILCFILHYPEILGYALDGEVSKFIYIVCNLGSMTKWKTVRTKQSSETNLKATMSQNLCFKTVLA